MKNRWCIDSSFKPQRVPSLYLLSKYRISSCPTFFNPLNYHSRVYGKEILHFNTTFFLGENHFCPTVRISWDFHSDLFIISLFTYQFRPMWVKDCSHGEKGKTQCRRIDDWQLEYLVTVFSYYYYSIFLFRRDINWGWTWISWIQLFNFNLLFNKWKSINILQKKYHSKRQWNITKKV